MTHAQDLLDLARQLTHLDGDQPRQATLRRAVSTAYYALFHLLVAEATLNWNRPELRSTLGRAFEHSKMKTASERTISRLNEVAKGRDRALSEPEPDRDLRRVAEAFIEAQRRRHKADYDTATTWTSLTAFEQVDTVSQAFDAWSAIRDTPEAQVYLVSMLGRQGY